MKWLARNCVWLLFVGKDISAPPFASKSNGSVPLQNRNAAILALIAPSVTAGAVMLAWAYRGDTARAGP